VNDHPFKQFVDEHPLIVLLFIAGFLRLLAVIFSAGYMASDDHFLVIRPAWDWINGKHTWFDGGEPIKRGILYPYLIFALLWTLEHLGIHDPGVQMFINRLFHAVWSMTLIPLVYYFLRRFADRRTAIAGGMIAAAHFIMPFMAVRNLVEVVSQPLVLGGLFLLEDVAYEDADGRHPRRTFFAGLLLGAAFMMRIQTALFGVGAVLVLLFKRRWRDAAWTALGGLAVLLVEGLIDYASFGMFLSSIFYSLYGQSHIIHEYVTGPWWTYLGDLLGALIPPFSLLALYWIFRAGKRVPITFWATLLFLVVHSIIPQKQERFILPAFGALIVLAMTGWSMVPWRDRRWVRALWVLFWIVNLLLLPVGTFDYSQKARVEPLKRLGRLSDMGGIVVVTIEHPQWLPYYYARMKGDDFYYVMKPAELADLGEVIRRVHENRNTPAPIHVIILSHKGPGEYMPALEAQLGPLKEEWHTGPSLADALLHMLNPRFNHSKESWVFKLENPAIGADLMNPPPDRIRAHDEPSK
jgi:hypothetical protein